MILFCPSLLITKRSIYVITTFFVQCKQSLSFVKIIQSTLWQKWILTYILVIDRSYQEYHILTPKFSFWRSLLFFCNFWVFCGGSLPDQDISILWTTNPIKGGITQKHFQKCIKLYLQCFSTAVALVVYSPNYSHFLNSMNRVNSVSSERNVNSVRGCS